MDKVYIEMYRSKQVADEELIEQAKRFFHDHGVQVARGTAFTADESRQFQPFSYTDPGQRDFVKAEMDAIHSIVDRHNHCILEDAAQAHSAPYRNRRVGGLAHAAAFSFYPTKPPGTYGEGGALTTDDDQIAKLARAARTQGQTGRYEHKVTGFNYRMQGFQAAVLRVKLLRLYSRTVRRQEIAREYGGQLAAARLETPLDDPGDECLYHQF